MKRFIAISYLLLFLFSTAATYGSVHHCGDELTDVAILSTASCDHDAPQEEAHEHKCCKKEKEEEKSHSCCTDENDCGNEDDDCCQTEELSLAKDLVTKVAAVESKLVNKKLSSFYDFYFESHFILRSTYGIAYVPPLLDRDITIEVQCFRL